MHLEFIWAVVGIGPHLFNADIHAFKDPPVHIDKTSGGGCSVLHVPKGGA